VNVTVHAKVEDTCDPTTWKIIDVTSNEDDDMDWIITGDHTVKLRAERSGGQERVYTITIQAMDAAGNLSAKKHVTVTVAKSRGKDKD